MRGPWPAQPLVYEINTRVWLGELSRHHGRAIGLGEVPDSELDALAGAGFDALWLMGVWTTGPAAAAVARSCAPVVEECRRALPDLDPDRDVVGSPYAIFDYSVPSRLGGDDGLRRLRGRMADRGLRLLLDFVPNHTALDHPLTLSRAEAFVEGTADDLAREPEAFFATAGGRILAHGRDPWFPPWSDTAQWNAAQPAGRQALIAALLRVADACDGARCDMAMLLLPEVLERTWGPRLGPRPLETSFWREAVAALRARHPGFLLLAEAYWGLEGRLLDEGFDYAYDKTLYDRLRAGDAPGVRAHLAADPAWQSRLCRFVENHDEERAEQAFGDVHRAAAAVALGAPGMKLVHDGQREGRRVRLPVQLDRRPEEPLQEPLRRYYAALLAALAARRHPARLLDVAPEPGARAVVALGWPGGALVANLGAEPASCRVLLPPPEGAPAWIPVERLGTGGGPPVVRLGAELRLELEPRGVRLFVLERGTAEPSREPALS